MANRSSKSKAHSDSKTVPDSHGVRSDKPRRPKPGLPSFAAAVRNGLEIARKGGLVERKPSPFEIVAEGENFRLRHYFPDTEPDSEYATRSPILLVPPLMMSADLWDIAPGSSSVATLYAAGADPWVVDFGSPEHEEGGLARDLTDHVLAVSDAVAAVKKATGKDVHLTGYSQGGMFAYQAAAYRKTRDISSLITFGSSVDLHGSLPAGLPPEMVIDVIERMSALQSSLIPDGIPSWATRMGFQMLDPIKTVQQRIDFVRRLSDREALKEREGVRRFMEADGWTAFPGPALAELMRQLVAQNRLLKGGLVIGDETVTLADITCPILAFVGLADTIAPPDTVRAIYAAAPQAEAYQVTIQTGHFGLVVGSKSTDEAWPAVTDWLKWRRGEGLLPASAKRLEDRPPKKRTRTGLDVAKSVGALALDLGSGAFSEATRGMGSRLGQLARFADAVAPQVLRINRLADIRSGSKISPGLSLLERADESPEDTFFLFEGRAHSYRAANERIDNIVRGLIEVGVRHGQHVGLLMQTRPSAVAASVALSRLGVIVVLLRSDLPLGDQLALTRIDHLLADPESGPEAHDVYGMDVLVLGGGGDARTLPDGLIDMEAIDPERVQLPDWFEPNPGLAGELAFILITGAEGNLRTSRVTNRRWATSAFGTASACALTPQDTVYCRSPIHHPTGILVCIGGALTSGARLAMASDFEGTIDAASFWQDVRRYGVNVVFYTGSLCRALLNAPPDPQERHSPIRLFAGSGMARQLWTRLRERFAPADVVEFFASTEGNAVLVNLTGKKVGSLGRPLPGAGDVAVAAWDLNAGRIDATRNGLARPCTPGRVGLLVERIDRERGELETRPLRSLFEAGDAWLDTRDLVRVDRDGDYWLVDYVRDVIQSEDGAVATVEIENLLAEHAEEIDLVAVYGVPKSSVAQLDSDEHDLVVAAVTLRPGKKLDPVAFRHLVERQLRPSQRPSVVRIVHEMPVTGGYRIRKRALRAEGLGFGDDARSEETWWLAPQSDCYQPLEHSRVGDLATLR